MCLDYSWRESGSGIVCLIAQMGLSGRENYMTILQYRFPIQCYVLMGYGLFLAICILIPGLAGGAIAGERERKTLDLLLTTHLSPWKLFWENWNLLSA